MYEIGLDISENNQMFNEQLKFYINISACYYGFADSLYNTEMMEDAMEKYFNGLEYLNKGEILIQNNKKISNFNKKRQKLML